MKAQFRKARRQLIDKMKDLRQQRTAIKNNPEMKAKYDQLGQAIVQTQRKIDSLNVALGIPIMTTKAFVHNNGEAKVDRQ